MAENFPWAQVDVKVIWVEERGLGLGVLKSDGYFVLVFAFIGGFCSSADVAWIGRKNMFYQARV